MAKASTLPSDILPDGLEKLLHGLHITSILHDYGLEAVSFSIEKHIDSLNSRFSKEYLLKSIKIILENNNRTFNDDFYRQISETAMNTIFVPT